MTDQQLREAFESEYSKLECLRDDAGEYIDAVTWGDWVAFKRGHAAAQPKWAEIKGGKYPATHDDVWCLLSNGHIVKGMFFSVAIGWEWDNENDDDADASVTHWALITPPLPPGPGERGRG